MDKAIEIFDYAQEMNPQDKQVFFNKGFIIFFYEGNTYFEMGHYQIAV